MINKVRQGLKVKLLKNVSVRGQLCMLKGQIATTTGRSVDNYISLHELEIGGIEYGIHTDDVEFNNVITVDFKNKRRL